MFTKSGKKLVRISIPPKSDYPPGDNGDTKIKNHVNGNGNSIVNSILDDLVSRGCTVTAIVPQEATIKAKLNSIAPTSSKSKKPVKPRPKPSSLSQIRAAQNCCILSNEVIVPQRRPDLSNIQKNNQTPISSVRPEAASNHLQQADQLKKKVFNAFKAKDSLSEVPKPQLPVFDQKNSTAETSTEKQPLADNQQTQEPQPNINVRKIINGTEYVPFTPPSNAVKRERLIQVNEHDIKPTLETAIQCDLIEDESSSESSSESDWISEIIEEYEFLEDGDMYECQICGEVCSNHMSHLKHSMTHKESSLLCFRCGRLFPNTSKLLAHEEKTHAGENLKIKKALRCPKLNCLKAFHSKRQLFDHIDQHSTKITDNRCSKCQRSFPSPLQLLSHMNRRKCWI